MDQINEKNLTSFFGTVPTTVELSFLGICLAPPNYKPEAYTGLTQFCSVIEHDGHRQPIILTIGNENSVASNNREVVYKSLHLDNITAGVGDPYKEIADKFSRMASKMGKNNEFIQSIFEPRFNEYRNVVKNIYPEELSAIDAAKENYVNALKAIFEQEQSKGENDSKKKTIAPAQAAM